MATEPVERAAFTAGWELRPFHPDAAASVISWVRDAQEQFWLAPRVRGALTPQALLAWQDSKRNPYLMVAESDPTPRAYGEINVLDGVTREYWLGHLIVAPQHRNRGAGRALTRLLLEAAFEVHEARRVSLVVFGENTPAVRCYLAAGMRHAGYEVHRFDDPDRSERLMRFVAERGEYR